MLRYIKNRLFPYFPKTITSITFYIRHKYFINWRRPTSFNEKISIRKLNPRDIHCELSDKYLVRSYVASKIGENYLVPLLWSGKNLQSADFECLPSRYVIKSNHASGKEHLEIVDDSSEIDMDSIISKFQLSMGITYGLHSGEMQYSKIEPMILIEEHLGINGRVPEDYKFHMFKQNNGDYEWFLQVDIGRFGNHKRNIYNSNLSRTDFHIKHTGCEFELNKEKIIEMSELAKVLCDDFNYVRVDFYLVGNKIYFGEMTFCHGGGYERFYPKAADYSFGELWHFESGQDYTA